MTIVFAVATAPVNPLTAAGPQLTIAQLWKGLELRVRRPALFDAGVESCRVLQDSGDAVLRDVRFKDGAPVREATEYITHIAPITTDVNAPAVGISTAVVVGTASRAVSLVSQGAEGEMFLTFAYEWEHADAGLVAGSKAYARVAAEYQAMASVAVGRAIDKIRGMVVMGEL